MSGLLIQLLLTMQAKGTMQQYPVHTAVYVLTVLILWWPFNTRYQITETHLNTRSMFVRWCIPLADDSARQPKSGFICGTGAFD